MNTTIRFNLTIEDWMAFQEYFRGKKAPVYRILMPLLGISAMLLILLNALYLMKNEASLVTVISGIFLLLIFYLFFLKNKSKGQLRKMALDMQAKNPDAFGDREMSFDEDGISIKVNQSSKELFWEDIDQWEENKEYFFLYSTKGVVYIIPKKGLQNTDGFRELLNQYFLLD